MSYEPPSDLIMLKRDFLIVEAGLSGHYDFTAGMRRLRELTDLIQQHPWWETVENAFEARAEVIKAAKSALPAGFPAALPAEIPVLPSAST
ncbi:hypothetical protein [Actinomadura geliboluensis]|uniref:hypothetical protein n=1 Tax=Actinomadura geliboluensis TaxID=882440 RepID=UPI0036B3C62F